jgi:hypothetical protein
MLYMPSVGSLKLPLEHAFAIPILGIKSGFKNTAMEELRIAIGEIEPSVNQTRFHPINNMKMHLP